MSQMPGYPCAVCKRQSKGFAFSRPYEPLTQFCSAECARKFMIHDPATNDERDAAVAGGNQGGDFLDSIGKTDLATLTAEEWAEFCTRIFVGACAHLAEQADDQIPF